MFYFINIAVILFTVTGTGDITVDMENQVKANSLRIKILEDQNAGLRNSITKMLQSQPYGYNKTNEQAFATPVMLWEPNNAAVDNAALEQYR